MHNELSRVVDALPGMVWTAGRDGDIDPEVQELA